MSSNDEPRISAVKIDVLSQKLLDAAVPGFMAECEQDEADAMGAFSEEALELDDVLAGAADLLDLKAT